MQKNALETFSEKQSSARAQVSPLERTGKNVPRSSVISSARAYCKNILDARNPRSSAHLSARAGWKTGQSAGGVISPLERTFPRSSGRSKSGNSRLHLQAQTQAQMHQNRSSWAENLENTCKHIILYVSKVNLMNQSPRVFQLNPISNQIFMNMISMNMHEL